MATQLHCTPQPCLNGKVAILINAQAQCMHFTQDAYMALVKAIAKNFIFIGVGKVLAIFKDEAPKSQPSIS